MLYFSKKVYYSRNTKSEGRKKGIKDQEISQRKIKQKGKEPEDEK